MLGRTANDLFWMARYMERAENIARLLEVGHRLTMLPHEGGAAEWRATLRSAGCEPAYLARHERVETGPVVEFLLRGRDNPSSVLFCLGAARRNARAQRTAITRDMWEALNSAWIEFPEVAARSLDGGELSGLLDWVRERSALFRGAFLNTILRNDTYRFTQLGTFLERADNTARILEVRYHVLLPENAMAGGVVDSAQWSAMLRSVSAHRSFRWVYRQAFRPWQIADFLILNAQMPRSLRSSYGEVVNALEKLELYYDEATPCRAAAQATLETIKGRTIDDILRGGLREFLLGFVAANGRLSSAIAAAYHFTA